MPTHIVWMLAVLPMVMVWIFAFFQGKAGDVFDAVCFYLLQGAAYAWLLVQMRRRPVDTTGQIQRASLAFFFVYLFAWAIAAFYSWDNLPHAGDGGGSPVMLYFLLAPLCLGCAMVATALKVFKKRKAR